MFRKLVAGRLSRNPHPDLDQPVEPTVPAARSGTDRGAGRIAALDPSAPPDHFGGIPHFANSPLPMIDAAGNVIAGTGLRKFVTALPGVGSARQNELGNYLPFAVPDTISYPGCDYYEIGVQQYAQQLHKDLQATRLRGYRQLNNGTDATGHNTIAPPARPYHLGPVIVAQRGRPVRVKLINQLPTGVDGDLFLPVDDTVGGGHPRNRTALRLVGADAPWGSAGRRDQWITPAGPDTPPCGAGLANVPDMPQPSDGAATLYYPNQQSARLLWFHDGAEGLSRLATYAGQVGLYLLHDHAEGRMVADGILPAENIPLIIQDKTFVPGDAQLAEQDPTWDRATWGSRGSLWFPHVYLPNQNPHHETGANPMGRWDYGPWYRQPGGETVHGPTTNPYHDPVTAPSQPPQAPGTPTPSMVPEALLDTPLVNGAAYPYLQVRPKAYRFRILNACLDRALNLQLYHAASNAPMWQPDSSLHDGGAGEVPMVPAVPTPDAPATWPADGRPGGVPDPAAAGPEMIQIGNDGGLLPAPVVLPNHPVDYVYDRRDPAVLNLAAYTLLLGPGESADVVIDFSSVPPGSNLILYNDCPAPIPAFDPRYDYHTGGPDQTARGGAPGTRPGYGPNTRTLLQFRVAGSPSAPFDLAALRIRLPLAYAASQPPPAVPQPVYDPAFGTSTPGPTYVPLQATTVAVPAADGGSPVTLPLERKTITERFESAYGRLVTGLAAQPAPGDGDGDGDGSAETLSPTADHPDVRLWRITNDASATAFVQLDHVCAQVVNRVGHNGAIRPPDGNELGWKRVLRIDPREDCMVAVRATLPTSLPFKVGDGWEYAWRCRPIPPVEAGATRSLRLRVAPPAPTGLSATAAPGAATVLPAIVLEWTGNDGPPAATGRLLERATDPGFTTGLTRIGLAPGAVSYTDSTVTPGVAYHYRIRAENAVTYSAWSHLVSATVRLLAPAGLAAAVPAAAPLRVSLAWTNRSFATGVDVQRATNPTFTAGTITRSVPATGNFLDATVVARTTYYYRVRTTYLGSASPWSNVAVENTPGRPDTPGELTATVANGGGQATVTVGWAPNPKTPVSEYVVQRAGDAQFVTDLATFVVPGAARSFASTDLSAGQTYYFRIHAVNAAGASAVSDPVSVAILG
nr:fibronectin type III domain-containing protein [Micromonospora sp. DSM 115978]